MVAEEERVGVVVEVVLVNFAEEFERNVGRLIEGVKERWRFLYSD